MTNLVPVEQVHEAAQRVAAIVRSSGLHTGERLQLLNHLLMILDHLLGKFFNLRVLGPLGRELAKLDFTLITQQQAAGKKFFDFLVHTTR
jgi:hypothetical protein